MVSPDNNQNNTPQVVIEGDDSAQPVSTTTFHNDAGTVHATTAAPKAVPNYLSEFSSSDQDQTIQDFLKKPVIIQQGTLTTTDTVSSFPPILTPYDTLYPMIMSKLDGFLGFKATSVFRIQINATPFQQGRYMLTSTNLAGTSMVPGDTGPAYVAAHTNTIFQRTQLPRVEIDINCDTEGVLRVPYVSALNWYPLTAKKNSILFGNVASVRLFPYVPLDAVTNLTCGYTIWHHFEDVETFVAAAPQSGRVTRGKGKTPQAVEQASIGVGPIQSALLRAKMVASKFSEYPLLTSYVKPLEWSLDLSAGVASVFGWSKPIHMGASTKVYRRINGDYCLTDTVDDSNVMALTQKNMVSILPGFGGTDMDELNLNYIASIPAYKYSTNWTTARVAGDALFELPVTPYTNPKQRLDASSVPWYDFIPIEFCCLYFNQWRGSLTYTFKFIKTEFHSGRLQIAFFPHDDILAVGPRDAQLAQYVHREIIDIREKNEITVTIPYCSIAPYLKVDAVGASLAGTSMGTLAVYVLDPLVGPATVSQACTILIEKSAGPDFELAIPQSRSCQPVLNATPESGSFSPDEIRNDCAIDSTVIGSGSITTGNSLVAEACVGEKITSFRTLLQSMNALYDITNAPAAIVRKNVHIYPFFANTTPLNTGNLAPVQTGDLYSALSGIFALARGGVRIKALAQRTSATDYPPVVTGQVSGTWDNTAPGFASVWNYGSTTTNGLNPPGVGSTLNSMSNSLSGPVHFPHLYTNGCVELRVPSYSRFHSRTCCDMMTAAYGVRSITSNYVLDISQYNDASNLMIVSRGAAEDTNFGCFVSIMPMSITSKTGSPILQVSFRVETHCVVHRTTSYGLIATRPYEFPVYLGEMCSSSGLLRFTRARSPCCFVVFLFWTRPLLLTSF